MISIFDKESTWFFDENLLPEDFQNLPYSFYKEAYMGWFINDTSTCNIIEKLPISRFYILKEGKLIELEKNKAIYAYKLFNEKFNNAQREL